MRFNKQELVAIASQSSQNFDREGILVLRERQDGFFRRSEGCTPRWFRLRGNILFYLRGTEPLSEPMGVIVLGRHQVKLQPQDENGHWPFQIVWDNGVCYRMATFLESERTLWLKAIQSAPYDNLKTQISVLKEKLSRVRPILDISTWRAQRGIVLDMNEIPLCELALSCDNLLCDAHGRAPSPTVRVFVQYARGQCVRYSATETVDTCSNPCFSRTVLFRACDGLTGETAVRLAVYDVRERVSETLALIGCASLPLSTVQEAQRLRIALTSRDGKTVGFVTLNGWSLEPSYIGTSPSHSNDRNSIDIPQKVHCHRRSQSLPPRLGVKLKFPSIGSLLKQNFVNSHQVTYRFHSGLGGDITVHEIMAESKLCFHMPNQLLDIFIHREKELLQVMLSIGEMTGPWRTRQLELVHAHVSLLKHYWQCKRSVHQRAPPAALKRSCEKEDASLAYVPVNLHLQRMWVHNDTLNKSGFHDVITVGAFASHTHKAERTGGLVRLVQQVKDINTTKDAFNSATASKIQAEYDTLVAVRRINEETAAILDSIANMAEQKQMDAIAPLLDQVVGKTKTLMGLWDPVSVEDAVSFVLWHKRKVAPPNGTVDGTQNVSTIERLSEQLSKFEMLSSDFDSLEASSGSSSKETSPTVELPPLSASVPNICNNKSAKDKDRLIKGIKEESELQFHNDYFKSEVEGNDRFSSLRLSKSRTSEQRMSLDHGLVGSARADHKSSSSLDQVSYRSLLCNFRMDDKQKRAEHRRESLPASDSERDGRPRPPRPHLARDIEDALSALRDAATALLTDGYCEERRDALLARTRSLSAATEALCDALRVSHAALRLRWESAPWTRAAAALQARRDTCFTQALTTASSGLLCWLCSAPHSVIVSLLRSGLGPLCSFSGLLSLYADERAMWGDMLVAVEDLHTAVFQLERASLCASPLPRVAGSRGALTVHIPVPDSLYAKLGPNEVSFTITAVFFNVGINAKASLAEALGETAPQHLSNCDNHERLLKYYHKYRKLFPDDLFAVARASSRTKPLEEVMENLRIAVQRDAPRDVELLQLADLATRLMNGIRFTSCKSAKDRTGMAATLEQCGILATEYHLAGHEFHKALAILRSEGCRRENAFKNIGVRKYAFTKKQALALPKDYRPPPGTYGSTQT